MSTDATMQKKPAAQDLATISGIVFDVDGVLTDGRIIYGDDGSELKHFHVQDGGSIKLLQQHGIAVAIITGRSSRVVQRRAQELGISFVLQGAGNKAHALDELISQGFPDSHLAAIGDDLADLDIFDHPAIRIAISVPNGHPAAMARADWVTERAGGTGVAVEIAQHILKAQQRWPYQT